MFICLPFASLLMFAVLRFQACCNRFKFLVTRPQMNAKAAVVVFRDLETNEQIPWQRNSRKNKSTAEQEDGQAGK